MNPEAEIAKIKYHLTHQPSVGSPQQIFLVHPETISELSHLPKLAQLHVEMIDSFEKADQKTLDPGKEYEWVLFPDNRLFVLDTSRLEKPSDLPYEFIVNRFYGARIDTTSKIVARKDHYSPRNFPHNDKLSSVVADLTS